MGKGAGAAAPKAKDKLTDAEKKKIKQENKVRNGIRSNTY
jgi:hypothetical protein